MTEYVAKRNPADPSLVEVFRALPQKRMIGGKTVERPVAGPRVGSVTGSAAHIRDRLEDNLKTVEVLRTALAFVEADEARHDAEKVSIAKEAYDIAKDEGKSDVEAMNAALRAIDREALRRGVSVP